MMQESIILTSWTDHYGISASSAIT